jgi:hypothetical protein
LKFGKRLLQVHEKSVNLAVLGEVWKILSLIPVVLSIINFWLHILQAPENGLLYDAYLSSYDQFYKGANDKWFHIVKLLTKNLVLNNICKR